MEAIKQFIMSGNYMGLIFIAAGILVGVFKQYWLIAGVNTASKKDLEMIDLEYVGKYFGIFFGVFGIILFFMPIIFRFLNLMKFGVFFFIISVFAFVIFLFVFGHIKKDRIYKKNDKK